MTAAPSDSGQCSCYVVTWQPAKIWAAFSDDWKKALDRNKLEYFKMREANSLRRQFSGWDNTERDKLLIALAQIIKRHVSLGITSALFYEDLERARMEYPDIAGEWKGRDQYQILFHGAIARLANYYINAKTKDRIQFIFDEQAVWGLQAIIETTALLPLLKPKERAIIAGPP